MKKKGFTLIELLAVIVILAIIALIATPLVLKYIEKSRKESKVDSAYSFVRNLETEIANYSIKNNGKKYTTDNENINELGLDITVKGENPIDGKVCISSVGQVEKGVFQYGKYYVIYDGKKGSISDKDTYDNFSCSWNVVGIGDKVVWEGTITDFAYNQEVYFAPYKNTFPDIESGLYKLSINDTIIDCFVASEDGMLMIISQGNPKIYLVFNKSNEQIISFYPMEETVKIKIIESDDIVDWAIFITPKPDTDTGNIEAYFSDDAFVAATTKDFVYTIHDSNGNLIYEYPYDAITFYVEEFYNRFRIAANDIDNEVYEAIQQSIDNNAPLLFTFTQTLETGEVITKAVSGVPMVKDDLIHYEGNPYYCWGNSDAFVMGE